MTLKKVKITHKAIVDKYLTIIAILSSIATLASLFGAIPNECKFITGIAFIISLVILYIGLWIWANNLQNIKIDIEGSEVIVKAGDIFEQNGLKVIAFNEYFDTQVDDKIISSKSLNGIFIDKYFNNNVEKLDDSIDGYMFDDEDKLENNINRREGKKQKYKLGTIFLYEDFILAAFTKFDEKNRAVLTMPEYLEFLIKFWDEINRVYAQKSVTVPIFGSGITRIKEHRNISDEELLKIMLWTFRISEMRFKYPARLTIVIHRDKIDKVNLLDITMAKNGL
jgi:hypothetical protein